MPAMENYQSLRHHHLQYVVEQLALLVIYRSLKVDENVERGEKNS